MNTRRRWLAAGAALPVLAWTSLVTSLARPDGMITGTSRLSGDAIRKVLEMLIESVPKLQRVGLLSDATALNRIGTEATARHMSEQLRVEAVVATE